MKSAIVCTSQTTSGSTQNPKHSWSASDVTETRSAWCWLISASE